MTYPICGNCMHSMSCHKRVDGSATLIYCAVCMNTCDDIDCHTPLEPSGTIVQDGQVYTLRRKKIA